MTIEDGSVAGLVLEDSTWVPIEGAIITLGEYETTTFVDGSYTIDVPPGEYQLSCEHDDYLYYTHPENLVVISSQITEINISLTPLVGSHNNSIPKVVELANYPNPFNPSTTISFSVVEQSDIDISIYNLKGQRVKQLEISNVELGMNEIVWNGDDESGKLVSSGIYFYTIISGDFEVSRKMLLLK